MKRTVRPHINDYPEILREQSLLGELSAELQAEIEASEGFAAFQSQRELENEQIFHQYPLSKMSQQIRNRVLTNDKPRDNLSNFSRIMFSVIPAAAALLVIILITQPFQSSLNNQDTTRIKGDVQNGFNNNISDVPVLEIWKQTGSAAIPLKSGSTVKAYDSLQIAYRAMGRSFGMIVSLDGTGKLTLHFPESFTASNSLRQGNAVVLPYAYQLDNAPRFERFFFITSTKPFKIDYIWNRIAQQLGGKSVPAVWAMDAALNLDPGFEASSFLLRK